MGYVFSEILPWIVAALVAGFLLGLAFWWCQWWLTRRHRWENEVVGLRATVDTATLRAKDLEHERSAMAARITELETGAHQVIDLRAERDRLDGELGGLRLELGRVRSETAGLRAQIELLEASATPTTAAAVGRGTIDLTELDLDEAALVLGRRIERDDLTVVEGIGPKIERLLTEAGVDTWRELARSEAWAIAALLELSGPGFRIHDPTTWPEQARLLSDGRWQAFAELTGRLQGGRVI
jgi:predicted flap endonuclease-1-like 5' DNA nuclease